MQRNSGFTLLEVLVAFLLLGTVGSALFQLYQSGLRNLSGSEELTHAALLARSRLSELRAIDTLTPGVYEGNLSGEHRWKLQLTPYEQDEPEPQGSGRPDRKWKLFIADLRIEWGPASKTRTYQLRTLLRARMSR